MSECKFQFTGNTHGRYFEHQCPECNRNTWSRFENPALSHRTCTIDGPASQSPAPQLPALRTRLANFTKAEIAHATAGAPTCTDEQIQERIAICRGCEHFSPDPYKPEIGSCNQCGCPVNDRLPKFVSKLAWADQECPIGKWGKASTPQ
jgi:hypothetical protein